MRKRSRPTTRRPTRGARRPPPGRRAGQQRAAVATSEPPPTLPETASARDRKTLASLRGLADLVIASARSGREPYVDVPSRSLSNVAYDARGGLLEMGPGTNRRELFNLAQARSYMQTFLVASGCKRLIEQGKTTSIRGLYYLLKHTIAGTKEETFHDQAECDPIIEDVEVVLDALREELHLYAQKRGDLVGDLVLVDRGDEIDCARMGSGGYGIPSIVEPETIRFGRCDARFVLHVEKDTVWQRFNEDRFWRKHRCILTHGGGQPPRGVRRLLHRLHAELGLPVYCLLDNDPWGYYIYSVIKQGSINLAHESRRMAVPAARFLGLRSKDYEQCGLTPSVKIALSERDVKRAREIARYPWFQRSRPWQEEIDGMLKNGFKLEVEALVSKDVSYVTEEYVPARLDGGDFLD